MDDLTQGEATYYELASAVRAGALVGVKIMIWDDPAGRRAHGAKDRGKVLVFTTAAEAHQYAAARGWVDRWGD